MQNTNQTQKRIGIQIGIVFAVIALSVVLCALVPGRAFADSYSMPKVDIQAEATTAGDLNIVEQRTFDFDGSFTAIWWTIGNVPGDGEIEVNSVSLVYLDSDGNPTEEVQQLPEEKFVLSWREEGGPKNPAYSVDFPQNTIYAFFPADYQKVQVTLDYTITNLVRAWEDVGEVYWQYVGDRWAEASDNVTMTLTIPVPDGEEISLGNNVQAWGHGPLDGTLEATSTNTITYTVPHLNAEQFAEAHVCFPVEWLTDHAAESQAAQNEKRTEHLPEVFREETAWADDANRQRTMAIAVIIGFGLIALVLLFWSIVMYQRYGKEYPLDFYEQYWRDVPSPGDHPTIIARLHRWNRENENDFTAALMYLTHKGAIQINKGSYEKPGLLGSKIVDDYYLTKVPAVADALTNPIDRKAINLLFDIIGGGSDSIWFGSIEKYGKDHAQEFIDALADWQGVVTGETNKRDFFEIKSKTLQTKMLVAAIVYVVLGVMISVFTSNLIPIIIAVPISIPIFFIANYMPRRSREGNNIEAKSKALQNWLKDFSALDERPPTDIKVWGEFMVYAYIFGIAKQVMSELQVNMPELFQEGDSAYTTGFVPWYFWYSSWHGTDGPIAPASDLFQTSVSNTLDTARAAISAASGDSSSGGGFGGGFSGGGGGGFGGGGGGAR